jgi:hypothetical protein
MGKLNPGRQRSAAGAMSSLSHKLPKRNIPKSAPPSPYRPKPNYGKPSGEGRKK